MHFIPSLFATDWSKRFVKLTPDRKCSNEESKWKEKAIESMIKKLKNQSDTLATLEKVLKKQSANTPCVTIGKTQDGRIQINQKKIFPHVAYCRLWRWPNLNNHNELKPVVDHCSKSFYHPKLSEVCINPFHYERVQASLCAASPSQLVADHSSVSNASFVTCNDQCSMDLSISDQSLNDQQLVLYSSQSNEPSPSDYQPAYHSSNDQSPGGHQHIYYSPHSADQSPNYHQPAYHSSNEQSPSDHQHVYHSSDEQSPSNRSFYHSPHPNEQSPSDHQQVYHTQPSSEQASNYCPLESPTFNGPAYNYPQAANCSDDLALVDSFISKCSIVLLALGVTSRFCQNNFASSTNHLFLLLFTF